MSGSKVHAVLDLGFGYRGIGLGWTKQLDWIGLDWIELGWSKELDGRDRDDAKTSRRPHRTAPHLDETCIHVCMYVQTAAHGHRQKKRRNESNRIELNGILFATFQCRPLLRSGAGGDEGIVIARRISRVCSPVWRRRYITISTLNMQSL
jgi:hypothetical protein